MRFGVRCSHGCAGDMGPRTVASPPPPRPSAAAYPCAGSIARAGRRPLRGPRRCSSHRAPSTGQTRIWPLEPLLILRNSLSTAASSEETAQTHRARRSASVYLVVSRRIRERACPPERWWVERGGDAPSGRCNRPPATPTRRGPDTTTSYIIEMPPRKRPAEPTRARIRRSAPASRASPRASSPTR